MQLLLSPVTKDVIYSLPRAQNHPRSTSVVMIWIRSILSVTGHFGSKICFDKVRQFGSAEWDQPNLIIEPEKS